MQLRIRRVELPSFGVAALLLGGILRLVAVSFFWPFPLVLASEIILLLSVTWLIMFNFLPTLFPPFQNIKTNYSQRYSFFFGLFALFAAMQIISYFLPSGRLKDITTTIAFLSFLSSLLWALFIYVFSRFAPLTRYLKRKPKEPERITFADVITSMAIIVAPTVAISFLYTPPGLSSSGITPNQVFISSLLTNFFMAGYLYLFVVRPRVFSWRQLGLRKVAKEDLAKAFLLFLLVSIAIVVLETLLTRLNLPIAQYTFSSKTNFYLVAIVAIGVTPLIEELYFRGFLFRGLLLHHRPQLAYGISALVFALLHPPLAVMIEVFIIGLLLAYVTQQTKSIWPNVLIHALNNALVIGYLFYK